ncbi:hypothetical protein [Mycobacterium malmoense]|uniref:hypothetical protein n=1 Tax=Mycobacterium malmoense TaxID=1780 RepID=UPI00210EBDE1|nr:hypothetical protein [Mycobacterium malmoense]
MIAIVAALSLFAAALGCWALRAEIAVGTPQSVAASPGAAAGSAWASHPGFGSTLNDDKAFKSAGLKRDRPMTFALSAPRSFWLPTPLGSSAGARQPGDTCPRAPSAGVTGHDLLTKLCVSRR